MLKTVTEIEFLIACVAVGVSISMTISIVAHATMEKLELPPRWRKPISILVQLISALAVIYLATAI